jgi:hippurate hydrolase
VGSLQAGTKENVIPDEAIIKLNVRTFDENVRKRVLASIERIVNAEAAAAGAPKPPEITPLDQYSLVTNDSAATKKVVDAFRQSFPEGSIEQTKPTMASEDFGCFGVQWHAPSVYWFFGGADADIYARAKGEGKLNTLPTNHNPRFAPVLHPTLETGVKALVVAAQAWMAS